MGKIMFWFGLKNKVEALESKLAIDVKADIATLMARVKTLETELVSRVIRLEEATYKKIT